MSKKDRKKDNNRRGVLSIKSIGRIIALSFLFVTLLVCFSLLFTVINHWLFAVLTLVVFTICIILFFVYMDPKNNLKSRGRNIIDVYSLSLAIAFTVYGIICIPQISFLFKNTRECNKLIPCIGSFLIAFCFAIFFIVRLIYTRKISGINEKVYHLCDFVNNNLPEKQEEAIIYEEEADEDLFGRVDLVDQICAALKKRTGTKRLIVAITGEWGSGKTTYLNLALKKLGQEEHNNLLISRNFSAWRYSDERSFLIAILNEIYSKLNIGLSDAVVSASISKYINMFLTAKHFQLGDIALPSTSGDETIIDIINDYLVQNNKHLIFVIDNIDRLKEKEMRFVYKSIGDILKIKNTTFVCLYDELYVERIFSSNKSPCNYLDKIVNIKINIDSPSSSKLYNVAYSSISNYCNKYNLSQVVCSRTTQEIDLLRNAVSHITNIRTLIVILNKFFTFIQLDTFSLNYTDYFCVMVLKKMNSQLFDFITKRPYFFVVANSQYLETTSPISQKEKMEEMRKAMIKELFDSGKKFADYKVFLDLLFPGSMNEYPISLSEKQIKDANHSKRIYSGKFFDDYIKDANFSFIPLYKAIEKILLLSNKKEVFDALYNQFISHSEEEQYEILKIIEELIDDQSIRQEIKLWIAMFLEKNYMVFRENSSIAAFFTPRMRITAIIYSILFASNAKDAKQYLRSLKRNPKKISLLSNLKSYDSRQFPKDEKSHLSDFFADILKETIDYSIKQGVNLFERAYFCHGILWILKNELSDKAFNLYLRKCLNMKTVFAILSCFVFSGISSNINERYFLSMDRATIESVITIKHIKSIISRAQVDSETDELIRDMFLSLALNPDLKESERFYSERPRDLWEYYEEDSEWDIDDDNSDQGNPSSDNE